MFILDMDGTVLTVNSFPRWAARMALGRIRVASVARRAKIAAHAMRLIARRKAGLNSHHAFKQNMQELWCSATDGDGGLNEREFVGELCRFVRPELVPLLDAIARCEVDAVLATAAPGEYAIGLGHALGLPHVLATPKAGAEDRFDNSGESKRDAVLKFLIERGWHARPRVLFTDHRDDLPLIRVSHVVHWFGSEAGRAEIEKAVPGVRISAGYYSGNVLASHVIAAEGG